MAKPSIEPISLTTLPEFAAFLERNMPAKRSAQQWVSGLNPGWSSAQPNFGFLMRDEGMVVGGIGALYADRVIRGNNERFCNITSWCVLDSHRKYSMQLAMNIVSQAGYHFTDFSPTKTVAGSLQFLKFKGLESRELAIPNFPSPSFSGKVIVRSPERESSLPEEMLKTWIDHSKFPWLHQLIVGTPGNWCHLIYKIGNYKKLPCAKLIYVGNGDSFLKHLSRLSWHFFLNGLMTTHVEQRMIPSIPKLAVVRDGFIQKQYLSQTLEGSDVDYLYSETVALDL